MKIIDSAVILAAGTGSRLRPITNDIPKAMVEIGKRKLIEYSIENLVNSGINNLGIVTGYMGHDLKSFLLEIFSNVNFTFFHNDIYNKTNSGYSLFIAHDFIDDDVLIMESDLIYEKNAIGGIIRSTYDNCFLGAKISSSNDEVFLVINKDNVLTDLGKNIENKKEAIGEFVGISKFSPGFMKELFSYMNHINESDLKTLHYEEIILEFSKACNTPVYVHYEPNLVWREIDREGDLKTVRTNIFPKLKQELSGKD